MKSLLVKTVVMAGLLALPFAASAQYRNDAVTETSSESQLIIEQAKTSETPIIITLEQALQIALSENVSVKVADMEIERTGYAKKGAYASLFPQIDMTGAYTLGCRVFTRPSQISGKPVTSLILITSTPLSAKSFIVPPVAIISQPKARSCCANSTTPVLSLTLTNALIFILCLIIC